MINYNCKNCGSPLSLNGNEKYINCLYCNTSFVIEGNQDNIDLSDLLRAAQTAEQSDNYIEALSFYNSALLKDENNFYALIGKAFASLAVFTYGKLNFKEFDFYFKRAMQNKNSIDDITIHEIILDKIWTMLGHSATIATNIFTDKYSTSSLAGNEYVDNLIVLHNVQKIIADVVDCVEHENVSDVYKDCYLEFKNASIAHGEQIFNVAKKFGVKVDKQLIKEIKMFIKKSQKDLKIFKKRYS